MAKVVQMTKAGLKTLKRELDEMLGVKRPKLVERISYARTEGDLAENSDYQTAKEELEFIDGRISEIEEVVKNAQVVNNGSRSGSGVGTKITVKQNGGRYVFEIVGEWEADPVNKKISPESPLGKALIGKKIGEKVLVEAPAGKVTYEILAIE